MTARNSQNCAEVIDFSRHVGKRCKEPADPFAGKSCRSGGGLSARTSRASGQSDRPRPRFLVDHGAACPPDCHYASRKVLPVRNDRRMIGADRRLVQRTGEFGMLQI